jgi:hypothetical protein
VSMRDVVACGVIVRNAAHRLLLADFADCGVGIRYDRSAFTSAG